MFTIQQIKRAGGVARLLMQRGLPTKAQLESLICARQVLESIATGECPDPQQYAQAYVETYDIEYMARGE